jgi:hypothetical protein
MLISTRRVEETSARVVGAPQEKKRMKNRFRAAVLPSPSPSSSLISRIRWNRCTGLLFITERVSHLATKRSLVARCWRIETSLVNTKTVLFHHRTANIFLYFCVQGRATIHVQGRFNNDAVVRLAYSAISYFSNLLSMIPARSSSSFPPRPSDEPLP